MQNPSVITIEEMMTEVDLFQSVYPDLIGEIERVEKARGKLNDFQLMLAVTYAKNGLGVLSYERRQTVNAIFTAFTDIYRKEGLIAADHWARETFGINNRTLSDEEVAEGETGIPEPAIDDEDVSLIEHRLEELSSIIRERETELLDIYREYHLLHTYLGKEECKGGVLDGQ